MLLLLGLSSVPPVACFICPDPGIISSMGQGRNSTAKLGKVAHTCTYSPWEAEAWGLPRIQKWPGLWNRTLPQKRRNGWMHAHLCCIFISRAPTYCLPWHRYCCALGLEYTPKDPWSKGLLPTWCYWKVVGLEVGLGHRGCALEGDCRTLCSFLLPFHLRPWWTDLLSLCFCHDCYERALCQELKAPKEWSQRPCFLSNWLLRALWKRSSAEPRPERNFRMISYSLKGLV